MPAWARTEYGNGRIAMAIPIRVVHHADLDALTDALASTLHPGEDIAVLEKLKPAEIRRRIRDAFWFDGASDSDWGSNYSDTQADAIAAAARDAVLRCYGDPPPLTTAGDEAAE